MYVVLPHTSWQGGPLRNFVPARPRCIPPAHGSDQGIKPVLRAIRTCGRSITTMSWRPTLRSLDERHFMETISSRPGREHFIAALSLEPSHRAKRLSRPLTTHSLDLEKCFSTNAEPCTNGCPFDHQSGQRSTCTRYPFGYALQIMSKRSVFGLDCDRDL